MATDIELFNAASSIFKDMSVATRIVSVVAVVLLSIGGGFALQKVSAQVACTADSQCSSFGPEFRCVSNRCNLPPPIWNLAPDTISGGQSGSFDVSGSSQVRGNFTVGSGFAFPVGAPAGSFITAGNVYTNALYSRTTGADNIWLGDTNDTVQIQGALTVSGVTINGNLGLGGNLTLTTPGATVDGVNLDNVVLTTGTYANPAWLTSLSWNKLTGFPAACPAGEYVTAVGGTLTCAAPAAGAETDPIYTAWYSGGSPTVSNTLRVVDGGAFGGYSPDVTWKITTPSLYVGDGVAGTILGAGDGQAAGDITTDGNLTVEGNIILPTGGATVDGVNLDSVLTNITAAPGGGLTVSGSGAARSITLRSDCNRGDALLWKETDWVCAGVGGGIATESDPIFGAWRQNATLANLTTQGVLDVQGTFVGRTLLLLNDLQVNRSAYVSQDLRVLRRVGIGVDISTPPSVPLSETLEVRDDTAGVARLRVTDTEQNPEVQLQYGAPTNNHWAIYTDRTDGNALKIWGAGAGGNDRLTIHTSGSVGVGTTSPSATLDVVGNLEVGGREIVNSAGELRMLDLADSDFNSSTLGYLILGTIGGTPLSSYTAQSCSTVCGSHGLACGNVISFPVGGGGSINPGASCIETTPGRTRLCFCQGALRPAVPL